MKNKIIKYAIPLLFFISFPLLLSILNILDIFPNKLIYTILNVIIYILLGTYLGINIKEKAYLKGIALGLLITILFIIISLIFKLIINKYTFIYYSIIISSTTLGSIIGLNAKIKGR